MAGYTLVAFDALASFGAGENPAAAQPRAVGTLLYHALGPRSKLVVIDDTALPDRVDYWLAQHGFRDHLQVLRNLRADEPLEGRARLVSQARQLGSVEFAVEFSPEKAARMLHLGVTTLLLSVPQYTLPEFRPDAGVRAGAPWATLIGERDAQDQLRAEDRRVTADVVGSQHERA